MLRLYFSRIGVDLFLAAFVAIGANPQCYASWHRHGSNRGSHSWRLGKHYYAWRSNDYEYGDETLRAPIKAVPSHLVPTSSWSAPRALPHLLLTLSLLLLDRACNTALRYRSRSTSKTYK